MKQDLWRKTRMNIEYGASFWAKVLAQFLSQILAKKNLSGKTSFAQMETQIPNCIVFCILVIFCCYSL